jgi:hypothetical protein
MEVTDVNDDNNPICPNCKEEIFCCDDENCQDGLNWIFEVGDIVTCFQRKGFIGNFHICNKCNERKEVEKMIEIKKWTELIKKH